LFQCCGEFIKQLKEIHFYVNISEYSLLHYVYILPGLWPFLGIPKDEEIFCNGHNHIKLVYYICILVFGRIVNTLLTGNTQGDGETQAVV